MQRILIRGAAIIDGNNTSPFTGDILTENGKITQIGSNISCEDCIVIEAGGLYASPGFIDGHTHNELDILHDRQHACALTQGVTSEVVGQCGLGVAPASSENLEAMIRLYAGIWDGYDARCHNWNSFGDFLDRFDRSAVNVACPVSHSALRVNALGFSSRKADKAALDQMCADAAQAMREGAVGFSTGLTYYPSGYAETDELIAICRVIKEHDGIFLVHKRDNFAWPRDVGDTEAVRIIRETGVRTHMLHYKTGAGNAGDIQSIMQPYQEALDAGCDISFEFYPYSTGAGFGIVMLPPWALEGGYGAVMERLADKALRQELERGSQIRYDFIVSPEGATFTAMKNTTEYEGKTFDEVCGFRNQNPVEMMLDLLLENDLEVGFRGNPLLEPSLTATENDFFTLLDLPYYTVGSDSIAYGRHAHPRAFGCFTKLLRLSREKGYPLQKLVHKITKYTAGRYRFANKGELKAGMDADVCIFDYNTVGDRATFARSRRMSEGMRYVLVGGELALDDGQVTGVLAGKALRPDSKSRKDA